MENSLGGLVQEARKQNNLDQVELGKLMGLDDATISKVENGHRPLYATELLALTLIFQDWFEFRSESFMEEITADLASRVREFLGKTKFTPEKSAKKDWFQRLLSRLDSFYEPEIA